VIASQGPVLAAPVDRWTRTSAPRSASAWPPPTRSWRTSSCCAPAGPTAITAVLNPARVGVATAAIYAALGDPARELPAALLAALATRACIWDPARLHFWLPAHAFAAPVADLFGELRGHVPGDTDEIRRGLARLGRRPSPDASDIVAALEGIAAAYGEQPLDEVELALVLRLLRRLHDLELSDESRARLQVPTRGGRAPAGARGPGRRRAVVLGSHPAGRARLRAPAGRPSSSIAWACSACRA
jgi:hypothetical protein